MKRFSLYLDLLVVVLLMLMVSCQSKPNATIAQVLLLAEEQPDSALAILGNVQYKNLSEAEKAKYAVVYTMAQDKSGLDVDQDSLIRIGYNWFEKHPDDSLYAKCQYYMGKYYMLNDSTEFAIRCFNQAYKISETTNDVHMECLALEKLSKVEISTGPEKALMHARMAAEKYKSCPNPTLINKIYLRLNLCEALEVADSLTSALRECQTALRMAEELGDSTVLADIYQDLSGIYREQGNYKNALICAKRLSAYRNTTHEVSSNLVLAGAYCDADSIRQAKNILTKVSLNSPDIKHLYYYMWCKAAIKEGQERQAVAFLDSTSYYLDEMYGEALQGKSDYYTSVLQKEKEEAQLQGKVAAQKKVTALVALLAFVAVGFILYVYYSYKRHAHQKASMAERLHAEELSHRDIQISTMRNFLLKKIDIMEKIETMRNEKEKHILISEDDWNEIEVFLDSVENLFVSRLREQFSTLTQKDLRLMMLLRLKMPQKTLASIYGISEKAIKQKLFLYKAKVGIEKEQYSLREFIETF